MRLSRSNLGFSKSISRKLEEFLADNNRSTLLIRGAWGTGKTFAVRDFFESGRGNKIQTFFYVSLAGQKTIGEELVVGGLERMRGTSFSDDARKLTGRLVNQVKEFGPIGKILTGVGDAALPFISKGILKGAVVVIDDVERKHGDLDLDSVLGTISRLSEVRGSKIIAIMNDAELSGDGPNILARKREKAFDLEIEFSPSVEQCLELVGANAFDGGRSVEAAARTFNVTNLRVIQKILWAVTDVCRRLRSEPNIETEAVETVANQTALLAGMRFRGKVPLTGSLLENNFTLFMMDRHEPEKAKENPFYDDLKACEFYKSPIDEVILGFLNTGSFDEDALKAAIVELRSQRRSTEYKTTIETVLNGIRSHFGRLTELEFDAAKRVTTEFLEHIEPGGPSYWAEVLQRSGIDCSLAELEQKWATLTPYAAEGLEGDSAMKLTDETAKKIFQQRKAEHASRGKSTTFEHMLSTGDLADAFILTLEAGDPTYLVERLRVAGDPRLIRNLGQIFVTLEQVQPYTQSHERFRNALFESVHALSGEDSLNELRLRGIIHQHEEWLKSRPAAGSGDLGRRPMYGPNS
jgi:hypothetical protein